MDSYARQKLQKNLKRVGLLTAPVWNKKTGNLVGGHQRLAALDALEGHADYFLDVAQVELDPATEREQNVFLNNPAVQGDWDLDALGALIKGGDFEIDCAGFDPMDLQVMFDDRELAKMFCADPVSSAMVQDIARIGAVKPEQQAPRFSDAERQAYRDKRNAWRRKLEQDPSDDSETYAVIVFPTERQRETFMTAMGSSSAERYLDGEALFVKLGVRKQAS
jgi:hypothetical protein